MSYITWIRTHYFFSTGNECCLSRLQSCIFIFSFGLGDFKVGLLSHEAFNSRVKFRSEAFVYLLLLASELSWRLPCFIRPILIHSLPAPNLYFCSWCASRSCLQLFFREDWKSEFIVAVLFPGNPVILPVFMCCHQICSSIWRPSHSTFGACI